MQVSNNRLSVGVTPKTTRHPKCGEMLLSVRGSPLGVFKEDNMETIQGVFENTASRLFTSQIIQLFFLKFSFDLLTETEDGWATRATVLKDSMLVAVSKEMLHVNMLFIELSLEWHVMFWVGLVSLVCCLSEQRLTTRRPPYFIWCFVVISTRFV